MAGLALIAAAFYIYTGNRNEAAGEGEAADVAGSNGPEAEQIGELSGRYDDPSGKFSFRYPSGFKAIAIPQEPGQTIVIQDSARTKSGIQIVVTPFEGDDADIDAQTIEASVPGMRIESAQEIHIGDDRKGLAFVSDNPAFDGASREVWFAWHGDLYQISTYVDQDALLKRIFETWQFLK